MKAGLVGMSAIAALVLAVSQAGADTFTEQSFSDVERIKLDGISGDVTIRAADGPDIRVEVSHEVRPADAFHVELDQRGGTVYLSEEWIGRRASGDVEWVIEVPASMTPTIEIDTSSGDLRATGVGAKFDFRTSSGDVRLEDMRVKGGSSFRTSSGDLRLTDTGFGEDVELETSSGDVTMDGVVAEAGFECTTSSGDVKLQRSHGVLEASSSSGDVRVRDTELSGPSRFSSSSGDVSVQLANPPAFELEVSSSSGRVRLDADFGNDFTLVMSTREDRGRIDSPFRATSQSTYERHGKRYVRQVVEQGSGSPEISLRTESGTITVSK